MKATFLSGVTELEGGGAALEVGADRVTRVLAKIAKGMCFSNHAGLVLSADTEWTVRTVRYDEVIAFNAHSHLWDVSDVLFAKAAAMPEDGLFFWLLVLFGQHPLAIFTRSRSRPNEWEPRPNDFMKLEWPKLPTRGDADV